MKNLTHHLFKLLTYVLPVVFCISSSTAQVPQYYSGGNSSDDPSPFNTSNDNKVQWIFIPYEFPGATSGLITKVYFKTNTTGTNKSFTDLTIKLGYTSAFYTTSGAFQTTGLVTVFYAPSITIPSTTAGEWVSFELSTPFYYDNTKNLLVEASTSGYTAPGFSVIQNTVNGNKKLYGNVNTSYGTEGSGLVNFGFDVLVYPDDAGVTEIIAPDAHICYGLHDVTATVRNKGNNVINNVMLNWTVNGIAQPPVAYNTPIGQTQTADITLGQYNFPLGKKQSIKVWTSDPNGNTDQDNSDDTAVLDRTAIDKPNGFIISAGTDTICPGDSVKLFAMTVTGNLTYQWQINVNDIPGATQDFLYVKNTGIYSISFSNGACTAQSNFKQIVVAAPVIDFGPDVYVCEKPQPYVLDPKMPNAVAYKWSTGDVTPTLDVKQSGTYWVEVTKVPGCIAKDTITLGFDPLPEVAGISYLQQHMTYAFTPGAMQHDVSYLWMFGDGEVSTEKSPIHTYADTKTRDVTFVVFNACGTDTATVQLVPTHINDVSGSDGINVYPNPAQDALHLAVPATVDGLPVDILNSLGQVVYAQVLPAQERHTINIGQLPAGSYILRVHSGNGIVNKRFDIMR